MSFRRGRFGVVMVFGVAALVGVSIWAGRGIWQAVSLARLAREAPPAPDGGTPLGLQFGEGCDERIQRGRHASDDALIGWFHDHASRLEDLRREIAAEEGWIYVAFREPRVGPAIWQIFSAHLDPREIERGDRRRARLREAFIPEMKSLGIGVAMESLPEEGEIRFVMSHVRGFLHEEWKGLVHRSTPPPYGLSSKDTKAHEGAHGGTCYRLIADGWYLYLQAWTL